MIELNEQFWDVKYRTHDTGWDMQQVSPPLKAYIDGIADKEINILIPGCGNAYEASYLLANGFEHVTLVDISQYLTDDLRLKFEDTPARIVHGDFFKFEGHFDLILEQAFFCTIPPQKRDDYVKKTSELLNEDGKIAGVLFNENIGYRELPPFTGTLEDYKKIFEKDFDIRVMEPCTNSLGPRVGNEIFIELQKINK